MKLSEALRLGEFALPPIKGTWFVRHLITGKPCGACAVGRAVYAAGYEPEALSRDVRLRSFFNYGRVEHNDEYARICCYVGLTWPWTRRIHPANPLWENAAVAYISGQYEAYDRPMSVLATFIEELEAKFDSSSICQPVSQVDCQPVTMDVTSTNKEVSCGSN